MTALAAAILLAAGSVGTAGEGPAPIVLPRPQIEAGLPLMRALKKRESTRAFSGRKLPSQVLSNLLWAAFGINRAEEGKRTAPSARNYQEIDIYVAMPGGVYLYDAKENTLQAVLSEDIRAHTGKQDFTQTAPVNLIYVADHSKMKAERVENRDFYAAADTGFISQNVYLYCASEGLATIVLGWVDKPELEKLLGLRPDQRVTLTQPVGYPGE